MWFDNRIVEADTTEDQSMGKCICFVLLIPANPHWQKS